MDAGTVAEAFAPYADARLLDHEGRDVADPSLNMTSFAERCQTSLKRAMWEEERALAPYLYVDPLDSVAVGERARPSDPRIVYFIGVSRSSGAVIASRLLLALHHSSHLYLIHVDLKAEPEVFRQLAELTKDHPNIRMLSTRRLVQWGGFTMVVTMLDAIASVVARSLDFDFFINLSDADMSLRTNAEVVDFLSKYKGRQFVQEHAAEPPPLHPLTRARAHPARCVTARCVPARCIGHAGWIRRNCTSLGSDLARLGLTGLGLTGLSLTGLGPAGLGPDWTGPD